MHKLFNELQKHHTSFIFVWPPTPARSQKMKRVLALSLGLFLWIALPSGLMAQAPLNNVILGHSGGAGSLNILRRIMERDKIWQKYGLNVKSVYFNSGTVLIQAMVGGNIIGSESELPGMVNLAVAGVADLKVVTVTINRIEHVFVVRKNIAKPDGLKGKRLAVSRIGSASDTITRMVLRSWKIDPDKETILLQSGNTPTRMTALTSGHVDGALVSPESVHKIVASGCCRALADLADLPMDYARYGYAFPASYIKTQRETLRRLLMAYLEGIYVFRTRSKAVYSALEEEDIKDPVVQKDVYERALKSVREFPVPEPNGIQSVLDSLPHPNARNVKPASVMDPSILEEIKRSGFIDKLYGRAG
ncbi:MAG: hypothetical protein DMG15_17675 [Acidobacteria bacterium]|nr:MAG: hypothetical protein DMG15_17675 [Acidobacteriota bacterium]